MTPAAGLARLFPDAAIGPDRDARTRSYVVAHCPSEDLPAILEELAALASQARRDEGVAALIREALGTSWPEVRGILLMGCHSLARRQNIPAAERETAGAIAALLSWHQTTDTVAPASDSDPDDIPF